MLYNTKALHQSERTNSLLLLDAVSFSMQHSIVHFWVPHMKFSNLVYKYGHMWAVLTHTDFAYPAMIVGIITQRARCSTSSEGRWTSQACSPRCSSSTYQSSIQTQRWSARRETRCSQCVRTGSKQNGYQTSWSARQVIPKLIHVGVLYARHYRVACDDKNMFQMFPKLSNVCYNLKWNTHHD